MEHSLAEYQKGHWGLREPRVSSLAHGGFPEGV